MFQGWLKRYEEIKQQKDKQEYCPICGRKLTK